MNRPLKICLASTARFAGGADMAAVNLAIELSRASHEVFMLLGRDGPVLERMETAGLQCTVAPMYFTDKWHWPRYSNACRSLRRILRDRRPDILHSIDLPTHQILSAAARGLGIPRICHHRSSFEPDAIDWFGKFGAELHLFSSQALMKDISAKSDRFRHARAAVVYDTIASPPEPKAEDRQRARKRLGIPAESVLLTLVGPIAQNRGIADVIRGWGFLSPAAQRCAELTFVGDNEPNPNEYRCAMERMAERLRCPARFVPAQNNVADWMLASDIFMAPSQKELLGEAVMYGMSFALPVIGTNVGCIPELVMHQQTGLLVPANDSLSLGGAMGRLIRCEQIRNRLGAEGRRQFEMRFGVGPHMHAIVQQYYEILQSTLDASQEPASRHMILQGNS